MAEQAQTKQGFKVESTVRTVWIILTAKIFESWGCFQAGVELAPPPPHPGTDDGVVQPARAQVELRGVGGCMQVERVSI